MRSQMQKRTARLLSILMVALMTPFALVDLAIADERQLIRFYSINDKGQERKLNMVRRADEPGCHDLSRFRKAWRVMVVGFQSCQVFSEPGCDVDNLIQPFWQKRRGGEFKIKNANGEMTRGTRWMLGQDQTNREIRSWRCVP